MFCEIGSSEELWGRQDAAEAMADLFQKGLGLGDGDAAGRGVGDWAAAPLGTPVLVGLGGGHYAPRHGDVVRQVGSIKTRNFKSNCSQEGSHSCPCLFPPGYVGMWVCRRGDVWVGHIISRYCLPMVEPFEEGSNGNGNGGVGGVESDELIGGTWREVVETAVGTTQRAFPGGNVMVHLDSK